jgi:hypothetical protein
MSDDFINDDSILEKKAKAVTIEKLKSLGVEYEEISNEEFMELVENRKQIILRDAKQSVVIGGVSVALTVFGGV